MGPHFQRPFSDAIQGNFCSGGSKICVQRTHRPRTDEASSQRFNPAGVTHMNSFPPDPKLDVRKDKCCFNEKADQLQP